MNLKKIVINCKTNGKKGGANDSRKGKRIHTL